MLLKLGMIWNYAMKKVFHLCHSSKEEVLFRNADDYYWGFNCYALALSKTDSCSLADAHMSDHRHLISQTGHPEKLMRINKLAYTRHMNTKYRRNGPLGEKGCFCLEIDGYHHLITAINYVLRNPLHHGVAPTPFAYPHCSANIVFRSQLGKYEEEILLDKRSYHSHVGRNVDIPDNFKMDKSGLFLRNAVTAVKQVEMLYMTPKNFLYNMNRLSNDKWIEEQKQDNVSQAPITLELIEKGVTLSSMDDMMNNEKGRENYNLISDIRLCEEIDRLVTNRYKSHSIYTLPYSHKQELFHLVKEKFHCGDNQTRRCLAIDYI